jgi:TonB family protein
VKLHHFLLISLFIHAAGVYLLRAQPLSIVEVPLQEIQLLEVSRSSHVQAPHRAQFHVRPVASAKVNAEPAEISTRLNETKEAPVQTNSESSATASGTDPVEISSLTEIPRVIKEKKIEYPPRAIREGLEGVVEMKLLITPDGVVEAAELVKGPAAILNEAALRAIKEFVFSPAKVGNQKVAVRLVYKYRFGGSK